MILESEHSRTLRNCMYVAADLMGWGITRKL